MRYLLLAIALVLSSCATNPVDAKRQQVLSCVKDMMDNGATGTDAFEICRQVYRLHKLQE